jgi:hypothetical protein
MSEALKLYVRHLEKHCELLEESGKDESKPQTPNEEALVRKLSSAF